MALELGNVVGKIGGGDVILDYDPGITLGNEWTVVAEFEVTTTSHVALTITHTSQADNWTAPAPTVTIRPSDGRSIVRGVNATRTDCSTGPGEAPVPINTAGWLEPGGYRVHAHSQRSGRNVGLARVTVTAVPV